MLIIIIANIHIIIRILIILIIKIVMIVVVIMIMRRIMVMILMRKEHKTNKHLHRSLARTSIFKACSRATSVRPIDSTRLWTREF